MSVCVPLDIFPTFLDLEFDLFTRESTPALFLSFVAILILMMALLPVPVSRATSILSLAVRRATVTTVIPRAIWGKGIVTTTLRRLVLRRLPVRG